MAKYFYSLCVLIYALSPCISHAQSLATKISDDFRGYTYRMCSAETTTGVCNNGAGDIYVNTDGMNDFYFTFTETAAGNSCDVYALHQGDLVADLDTIDGAGGFKLNGTPLTVSNPAQWFQVRAKYMFVSCTAVSGTFTVDVMMAESGTRRGE